MQSSLPVFQSDGVQIFCPYGDPLDITGESLTLFSQIARCCQKIFTPTKLKSGVTTMFGTSLNSYHLERMNQNILFMQKKDVHLKCECSVGDIELSCGCFTLGDGKLSFNLSDCVVVVLDYYYYSIFLVDISRLYSTLCQKVRQVQLEFADQMGELFIQEVNWIYDIEAMGVRNINE